MDAQHARTSSPRVRVESLVRADHDQVSRSRGGIDEAADHRVGVAARGRHADGNGAELLLGPVGAQGPAIEDHDGASALRATEDGHSAHDLGATVVALAGTAPGTQHVVAVDQVGHGRPAASANGRAAV